VRERERRGGGGGGGGEGERDRERECVSMQRRIQHKRTIAAVSCLSDICIMYAGMHA